MSPEDRAGRCRQGRWEARGAHSALRALRVAVRGAEPGAFPEPGSVWGLSPTPMVRGQLQKSPFVLQDEAFAQVFVPARPCDCTGSAEGSRRRALPCTPGVGSFRLRERLGAPEGRGGRRAGSTTQLRAALGRVHRPQQPVARRGLGARPGAWREVSRVGVAGAWGVLESLAAQARSVGAVASGRMRLAETWGRHCGRLRTGGPQGRSRLCRQVRGKMACPLWAQDRRRVGRFSGLLVLREGLTPPPRCAPQPPKTREADPHRERGPVPVQPSAVPPRQCRPGRGHASISGTEAVSLTPSIRPPAQSLSGQPPTPRDPTT